MKFLIPILLALPQAAIAKSKDPCDNTSVAEAAASDLVEAYSASRADADNNDPDRIDNDRDRVKLAGKLVEHGLLAARTNGADDTRVRPERVDQSRHADASSSGITLSTRGR